MRIARLEARIEDIDEHLEALGRTLTEIRGVLARAQAAEADKREALTCRLDGLEAGLAAVIERIEKVELERR